MGCMHRVQFSWYGNQRSSLIRHLWQCHCFLNNLNIFERDSLYEEDEKAHLFKLRQTCLLDSIFHIWHNFLAKIPHGFYTSKSKQIMYELRMYISCLQIFPHNRTHGAPNYKTIFFFKWGNNTHQYILANGAHPFATWPAIN